MFTLRLLGGATLQGDEGPLSGPVAQRQRLALLAVLALSKAGAVSRDSLLAALWPESDAGKARHSLSSAIYGIRQALGDEVLLTAGDDLRLNDQLIDVDVLVFESAVREQHLEKAVALYRGPFLDGFSLNNVEFERWVDSERTRLARIYAESLEALATRAARSGEVREAAGWWRRAATHDPYSSHTAVELMKALHAAGDSAGALNHGRIHAALVAGEFGIQPDPAVAELAEHIRAVSEAGDAAASSKPPTDRKKGGAGPLAAAPEPTSQRPVDAQWSGAIGGEARLRGAAFATGARFGRVAWRNRNKLLAGAAAVAAVGGTALLLPRDGLNEARVVVAVFENRTGDPELDPLGPLAADWISRGIRESGFGEIVPPEVRPATGARGGSDSLLRIAAVQALARATGAGTVVAGAYYLVNDSLQFEGRVIDARTGQLIMVPDPVRGSRDNVDAILQGLRLEAIRHTAMLADSSLLPYLPEGGRPPSLEAYQAYATGEELRGLMLGSWRYAEQALRSYYRAFELDSTFTAPLMRAIWVHLATGDLAAADSLAQFVSRRGLGLTAASWNSLDLVYALSRGDRAEALRVARRWGGPDQALHALQLNHPRETIEHLERDPPLLAGWLTAAHHMLGDHRAEVRAARRFRERDRELLGRVVLEVRGLAALGRVEEVDALLDESLLLPPQPGWIPAYVMQRAAAEYRAHGRHERSLATAERAVEWFRSRPPDEASTAERRSDLARALYQTERWDEARALCQQLASESPNDVNYQGYLGVLAARRRDRDEALRISEGLAGLADRYDFGRDTYWQACIAALLGERERAMVLLRDAYAQGRAFTLQLHRDMDLEPLHDYPPFQDFLRPKG